MKLIFISLMILLVMLLACGSPPPENAGREEKPAVSSAYTLTVLNPQGHVKKDKALAPRLDALEGKKIAMYLSATRDHLYAGKGADLYDILEKRLSKEYPNTEIVHYADLPMKFSPENEVVDAIVKTKPDAVVIGFGE